MHLLIPLLLKNLNVMAINCGDQLFLSGDLGHPRPSSGSIPKGRGEGILLPIAVYYRNCQSIQL